MGLFDFLRPKAHTEQYQEKRKREAERLSRQYDLTTVEGIEAIPVPAHKEAPTSSLPDVTGRIEYLLMVKAGEYQKTGDVEMALACMRKANQLMPMSCVSYQYDTYMRLPRYLRQLRRFDEARAEETKIAPMFPPDGVFEMSKDEFVRDMLTAGHSKAKALSLYTEYKKEREQDHLKAALRKDYEWLWEFLPNICPKSFSAYVRMKNANTEKYQSLVAAAQKLGRKIA